MDEFIIIEVKIFEEYKIGMLSHRYVGPKMYMPLADIYYLGNHVGKEWNKRVNKFATYEEAVKAINELYDDREKLKEYDDVMLGCDFRDKDLFK